MKITIQRTIFLHDVEIEVSEQPTQEEIDEAVKKVLEENQDFNDWDERSYYGDECVTASDDESGVEIFEL